MSLNPTSGDKRSDPPRGEQPLGQDGSVPAELSHAGAVIDKAIEYMLGENLPRRGLAAPRGGGGGGVGGRAPDEAAMVRMLQNAIASVRAGELHPTNDREAGRA